MGRVRTAISEMVEDASRGIFSLWGSTWSGLRSVFRSVGNTFWGRQPAYDNTIINFDYARQLYRNDGSDSALGAAFCRPIVDLQVAFMGTPHASTDDDALNDRLNECLELYWTDELQQMFRNSIRDSKTVIRYWQEPMVDDPFMTIEENEHGRIETIDPERITIQRSLRNKNVIDRAVVQHRMFMVDEKGDPKSGNLPQTSEHEVVEIVTKDEVVFFDRTDQKELTDLNYRNTLGFVPFEEVWNEYDSTLSGGQSDLEGVVPFVRALHDVMAQGLQAHKYHSVPKVKFKIKEIEPFIKNNFPSALDESGNIKPGASISWQGKEMLFFAPDEDAEFLEARSVLGDTKSLVEILVDFICIASSTPEWAFMRVDAGSANSDRNAQTVPFVKKIARKRKQFQRSVQNVLKMYLVANGFQPVRARITWEPVRADDQMVLMQALQQLIMGLEVALQSGQISDRTYKEMIRMFIPMMKNPEDEAKDAEKNKPLPQPALAIPAAGSNGKGSQDKIPIAAGPQGKNE